MKVIGVPAQLGHNERHPLSHQAGNKRYIAGKAINLRHNHAVLELSGGMECSCKLWSPFERVSALPCSNSTYSPTRVIPSASANRATAVRWASMPRPERCCLFVDTR